MVVDMPERWWLTADWQAKADQFGAAVAPGVVLHNAAQHIISSYRSWGSRQHVWGWLVFQASILGRGEHSLHTVELAAASC